MNCYFCNEKCIINDHLVKCENHKSIVYYGIDPYFIFFYYGKPASIIIVIYPNNNSCKISSIYTNKDILAFNFIPNLSPENINEKLKLYLTFS
jgi:hypothetical protein